MSDDPKQLFRDVVEQIWHRGNLAFIREAFLPRFVGNVNRGPVQDLREYRRQVAAARAAFPDIRFAVQQQVGEGDLVVSRYLVRGTHRGDFLGIPPTGRPIAVEGMTMQRLTHGRIAESWTSRDVMGLMQAIGVLPHVPDVLGAA